MMACILDQQCALYFHYTTVFKSVLMNPFPDVFSQSNNKGLITTLINLLNNSKWAYLENLFSNGQKSISVTTATRKPFKTQK